MSRIIVFKLANYKSHKCLRCGVSGNLVQFYGLKTEPAKKRYPIYCALHVPSQEMIQKALSDIK